MEILREVVQESSADYWFERGLAAEASAQWGEAAYAYQQCVRCDAEHWRGGVRLAAALGQLNQPNAAAAALIAFSELITYNHNRVLMVLSTGDEVWQEGKRSWGFMVRELSEPTWQLVRHQLEAARSTTQNGFQLLLALTLVYRALANWEQARHTMDVMKFMYGQQVAQSAQWFRLSGFLYMGERFRNLPEGEDYIVHIHKITKRAIAEWNSAIALAPNYADTYFNRALAKLSFKNYSEAVEDYNRAIQLQPDNDYFYIKRASVKEKMEDYTGALADYDAAIGLNPCSFNYTARGCAKEEMNDEAGANADHNRAAELYAEHRE